MKLFKSLYTINICIFYPTKSSSCMTHEFYRQITWHKLTFISVEFCVEISVDRYCCHSPFLGRLLDFITCHTIKIVFMPCVRLFVIKYIRVKIGYWYVKCKGFAYFSRLLSYIQADHPTSVFVFVGRRRFMSWSCFVLFCVIRERIQCLAMTQQCLRWRELRNRRCRTLFSYRAKLPNQQAQQWPSCADRANFCVMVSHFFVTVFG